MDNLINSSAGGKSKKKGKENDSSRIPWHPAFVEAIQLELQDYADFLEFKTEFQLTSEPLKIARKEFTQGRRGVKEKLLRGS